jgi:HD-GYP domain-containing protein (c-di-GMP phosphodiesterase class II)/HAMP domain-containing protein
VVFCAFSYFKTSAGLHGIENRQLASSTTAVEKGMAQYLTGSVSSYAASQPFVDAVVRGDRARATRSLLGIMQTLNLVQAQVLGVDGRLLARVSMLPSPRSIGTGHSAFSFQTYLGKPWVVVSIPILADGRRGKPVGSLLVADQIDDAVLQGVAQQSGAPANIYVGGLLAASSMQGSERPLKPLAPVGARYSASGWTTSYTALRDAHGQDVAVLSVGVTDGGFTAIRSAVRGTAALALVLALAAATLAALLSAHTVTRPLKKLSRAAEAIAGGNMRQHVDVKGHDEVAVVAKAFNGMSEWIAETVDGLSDQIQDLSRGLADLSFVGETLAQSRDVKAELFGVADRVREMTHSNFCGIHLLDGEAMMAGIYAGTVNGSMLAVEELALWVTNADQSATTSSLARDERVSEQARRAATGISNLSVAPVVHQGRPVGAISVGSSGDVEYARDTAAVLATVASQVATALRHAETFNELERSYLQTVTALAAALEAKDKCTADHADSIAKMALAVGDHIGLSDQDLRQLQYAALLHDVGKIGIPRQILEKPGKLSEAEFTVVARHTLIGERILSRIDYLRSLAPVIRAAHERWDGRGYPDGLAGEAIPLESRIIFVCDAFHAMTSDRPYRSRLTEKAAVRELQENAGTQFDPAVVLAFLKAWPVGDIALQETDARAQAAR